MAQGAQEAAPAAGEDVPCGHCVQPVTPTPPALKEPAAHGVATPPVHALPAGQAEGVVEPEAQT